ncbi:S-layer homology domain-containing protein [Arthrobacter sp. NPDC080031]|uniref:S-layer homology domain-containing protein n=1 Tax=Arthrobacter sp. NPDC080031 TaxID=3155918 RepID=UPI00344F78F8
MSGALPAANAATNTGSISGTVGGAAGVTPSLAVVELFSTASFGSPGSFTSTAFPAQDGTYQLGNVAPGTYKLLFDSGQSNGLSQWYGGSSFVTAATITIGSGQSLAGFNATLLKGSMISGTFTLPAGADYTSSSGSRLSLFDASSGTEINIGTDEGYNGSSTVLFDFKGLTAGSYKLLFHGGASGAKDQWYKNGDSLQAADTIRVLAGQDVALTDWTLGLGATISGTVTLPARTDLPAPDPTGVAVSAYPANGTDPESQPGSGFNLTPPVRTAMVRPDGTYQLKGLSTASYKLKFTADANTIPQWYNGQGSFATATPVAITGVSDTPGINATLARLSTVSGKVTVPSGEDPTNIYVDLRLANSPSTSYETGVAADGTYKFNAVSAGSYTLSYSDRSAVSLRQWWSGAQTSDSATVLKVPASQGVADINATLIKAGRINGKVSAPAGTSLSMRFTFYKDDATQTMAGWGWTQNDGTFTIAGLVAGKYKIAFGSNPQIWYQNSSNFATATPVTVVDAQDTNIEFTVAPSAPSFTDVATDNPFYKQISWLSAAGISTGWTAADGTKTFQPLSPVNRDAMAAFLYRLAGSPVFTPPAVSPFTDVATDNPFYKQITWLADKGISTGYAGPNNTRSFQPLSPVNRDAMAAFLYRFAGTPAFTAQAVSPFADIPTASLFYKEISWLASTGISTGWTAPDGTRTFQPVTAVHRDAMAAFMYRYNNLPK